MEVSGQLHATVALPPGKRVPDTHWIGGLVDPRAGLDAVLKRKIPSPCWDSNPPIIQPVVQRYRPIFMLSYLRQFHLCLEQIRVSLQHQFAVALFNVGRDT
jgi:hypothetical protein